MNAPRVLVVDDDAAVRAVLADVLADAHYYVAALDDGAGVLDALRAQQPDLLILDLAMHGVDGVQILAQLRALDNPVPVLVVTALPMADPPHIPGASAVLQKPFDTQALVAVVARLIGPAPAPVATLHAAVTTDAPLPGAGAAAQAVADAAADMAATYAVDAPPEPAA